jgi:hypothetical protein
VVVQAAWQAAGRKLILCQHSCFCLLQAAANAHTCVMLQDQLAAGAQQVEPAGGIASS